MKKPFCTILFTIILLWQSSNEWLIAQSPTNQAPNSSEYTHDIAFVLRGYSGSCEVCDIASFDVHAKKIMKFMSQISFGKIKTYKILMNGIDSRPPESMQSVRDIEVLQASLDGWPGEKWAWVAFQSGYWKTVPAEYRPIITNAIEWMKANKKDFASWGTATPEGKIHYPTIQTNVQRMGSGSAKDYLLDMRMPAGFDHKNFGTTLIIFNTLSPKRIAGGGLQSSFSNFGILDPNGMPYNSSKDANVAYVDAKFDLTTVYSTSVHEAIHAFGMGTHDQDPNNLAIDYSVMKGGALNFINTLPAWNRYYWCKWLPQSTITTNANEITDLKNRYNPSDANLKYILEVVKGDDRGRGGTYKELYDGKWYTYKLDAGGTLTFMDKLDNISYKPTLYIDVIPEVIIENKSAKFRIFNDGELDFFYQWYKDGNPIPNATADTLIFKTVKLADAGYYSVRISNFHGSLTTVPVRVKVQCAAGPSPFPDQQINYCQHSSPPPFNLKPDQGNTLLWYTTDTATVGAFVAPMVPTQQIGFTSIKVSQVNSSGCESPKSTVDIRILPLPPAPVSDNREVCQNTVVNSLDVKFDLGNTLKWYTSDTSRSGTATMPTIPTNQIGIIKRYVTQVNSPGCESSKIAINVTIKSSPSAPITENIEVCQFVLSLPQTIKFDASNSLIWYTSDTSKNGISTSQLLSNLPIGNTKYFVAQGSNKGCESPRSVLQVKVNPSPAVLTETKMDICQNNSFNSIPIKLDLGNTLRWYISDTSRVSIANTSIISTTGNAVYYTAQANNIGCESQRSKITLNVRPTPKPPTPEDIEFCQFTSPKSINIKSDDFHWLGWYATDTSASFTSLFPIISNQKAGLTQYFVSQYDPSVGCHSPKAILKVKVNEQPIPPIPENKELCQFSPATPINVKFIEGHTLKWYPFSFSTTGSVSPPVISTSPNYGNYIHYVTQTNNQGCESAKAEVLVSVKYTPAPPMPFYTEEVCQFAEIRTPLRVDFPPDKVLWYTTDTSRIGTTITPILSSAISGITQYWVTQSNEGCESERTKVKFTVKPSPAIPTLKLVNTSEIQSSAKNNQWFLNGRMIADTSQTIKPKQSGNYTAIAIEDKCLSLVSQPLNFVVTGIEDDLIRSIAINPNPFTNFITVTYADNFAKLTRLEIISITGIQLKSINNIPSGTVIDVADIPAGIYLIRLKVGAHYFSPGYKLVKYK